MLYDLFFLKQSVKLYGFQEMLFTFKNLIGSLLTAHLYFMYNI